MEELEKLLKSCVRCGSCREVCPVFREVLEEPAVARGKIFLFSAYKKGELKPDKKLLNFLNLCTTCLRCQEVCSAGVNYEDIIIKARSEISNVVGIPLEKKLTNSLLTFKAGLGLLGSLSKPLSGILKKRGLPSPSIVPFTFKKASEKKGKEPIVFFVGCMMNFFYQETAKSIVKILNELQYDVIIPKNQTCCGAPAIYSGDLKTFEKLKEENLKVLEEYRGIKVVTGCPTCTHVLRKFYGIEAVEFLEILMEKGVERKKTTKITWHHPCHLVRGLKIDKKSVEDYVSTLADFTPLEESDNCCGFGGSFMISFPKISGKIRSKKVKNILATGAELVLTECPGCVMNINLGLLGKRVKVLHIADFLAKTHL